MISKIMRYLLLPACLVLLLGGCLSVYKVEVQQGNVITQEMIDKLKPGMTANVTIVAPGCNAWPSDPPGTPGCGTPPETQTISISQGSTVAFVTHGDSYDISFVSGTASMGTFSLAPS